MSVQPHILIIDDQSGRDLEVRADLCEVYELDDVTTSGSAAHVPTDRIAATFCSSQHVTREVIENSVGLALEGIERGWPLPDGGRWALMLLDLRFASGPIDRDGQPAGRTGDDEFGLQILEAAIARFPDLPIVVLSSRDRGEVIEACRRLGALDFIQRHSGGADGAPSALLRAKLAEFGLLEDDRGIIAGRSLPLLRALAAARRAATGGGNILLLGETGTGKELVARYIHDHSPKAAGPYKVFHAFGTADTLQEDLLFGHVKGAFTDARADRAGLFEEADGGTLLIDEVGDIPPRLQEKLLRPLETRSVSRQGAAGDISVDVQVVLATNKALDAAAARGDFRLDLLNRIRAYSIVLPPLRDRGEDLPVLAETLLAQLCREHRARWPRRITADAFKWLEAQDWREGNVRELRNVLERAVKDNKDAELVVASDLRVDAIAPEPDAPRAGTSERPPRGAGASPVKTLGSVTFDSSYEALEGTWPVVRREVALLLGRYLGAALKATRVRRPGTPGKPQINLAGAVGCVWGHRVTTAQAADFVKKLLYFDDDILGQIVEDDEELRSALETALRARPVRPARRSGDR